MDANRGKRMKQRLAEFELFIADVIYDRRQGGAVDVLAAVLKALSTVFTLIVRLRTWLYEKRIFHTKPLGCLVVVVGNITMGGTGKTPVVERFARSLAEQGRKVAILSRGYKSKKEPVYRKWIRWLTHAEAPPPKVVSDGERLYLDSDEAGDEPYMLARNLLRFGVHVIVDKNRVKAGAYAIKRYGVDTLILDDGFQYLPLKGRLNLLLIDKNNPFGNSYTIPRGILREPVDHIKRASYVFITKSDGEPDRDLRATIENYNPGVDVIECRHAPQHISSLNQTEAFPLDWIQHKHIAAFSGIATPESFESFLINLGAELRYTKRFIDHHRFSEDEILDVIEEAKKAGAACVMTTEKDAVRLDPNRDWGLPIYFLRLEIDILEGAEDFEAAVARICSLDKA
ncbi:MAG: tetraacyldisaccharide 4'-kinase [Opitutales bacterium]|nr:tetraacyldisaccharide 4'-kinase [Opitutales bacterium]NRA26811.1 tetraacyldisaccharide 4'-kinase [Opitutales bacterium]